MKKIIYLATLLLMASCNNIKSVVVDDHGTEIKVNGLKDAYIALGRTRYDSTFTETINFDDKKFYGKIKAVSADSLRIVSEYNGMLMYIVLKSPIKKKIVYDGRMER